MAEETRLKFLGSIPKGDVRVACSGGPDSMALVDFLVRGGRKVHMLFFHHDTVDSHNGYQAVREYYRDNAFRTRFTIKKIESPNKPDGKSLEEHWRDERLAWLQTEGFDVLTGHNLDDVCETWIWSCLHGEGKIIPYRNKNIVRPLLLTKKETLRSWCLTHGVDYVNDESNDDVSGKYMRPIVRHNIMPEALRINPGLYKVMRKKLLERRDKDASTRP